MDFLVICHLQKYVANIFFLNHSILNLTSPVVLYCNYKKKIQDANVIKIFFIYMTWIGIGI